MCIYIAKKDTWFDVGTRAILDTWFDMPQWTCGRCGSTACKMGDFIGIRDGKRDGEVCNICEFFEVPLDVTTLDKLRNDRTFDPVPFRAKPSTWFDVGTVVHCIADLSKGASVCTRCGDTRCEYGLWEGERGGETTQAAIFDCEVTTDYDSDLD